MGPQVYSIVMSSTHLIEIDKKSGDKTGHSLYYSVLMIVIFDNG